MTDFDSPWKDALDTYFQQFCEFFFPEVHRGIDWSRGYDLLDQELSQLVRDAEIGRRVVDRLVRVWQVDGEEAWVLVHVEVQSQYEPRFSERMFVYHYRLFDKHRRHPVNLAVLADDRPGWKPSDYSRGRWGCQITLLYPTIKLLDYADRTSELASHPNPFATVVLAHLRTIETRDDPEARRSSKTALVRGLYERGLDRDDVIRLFRFIDWLMDLPPELESAFQQELIDIEQEKQMPYVTTIERQGIERGRVEGREEGRVEGREEGRVEGREEGSRGQLLLDIETGLRCKFGEEGLALLPRIQQIGDLGKLQSILERLWTADDPRELPLD